MSDWITVAKVDDVPAGASVAVDVDGASVLVVNLDGRFFAIEDACTHDGQPLAGAAVQGAEVVCPRHAARFDIRTGAVTAPPAVEPLHCFPLRVREGHIEVRDDRWT